MKEIILTIVPLILFWTLARIWLIRKLGRNMTPVKSGVSNSPMFQRISLDVIFLFVASIIAGATESLVPITIAVIMLSLWSWGENN